jgi:hypothetical protein
MLFYSLGYLPIALIPLVIVEASTGFRAGTDLLAWLIIGSVSFVYVRYFSENIVVSRRS